MRHAPGLYAMRACCPSGVRRCQPVPTIMTSIPNRGAAMSASKRKSPIPLHDVRRYLEPGPVLLVSSAHGGERDVMVMGWHTVMEFSPSLVGCVISSANHSFGLIRASGE